MPQSIRIAHLTNHLKNSWTYDQNLQTNFTVLIIDFKKMLGKLVMDAHETLMDVIMRGVLKGFRAIHRLSTYYYYYYNVSNVILYGV